MITDKRRILGIKCNVGFLRKLQTVIVRWGLGSFFLRNLLSKITIKTYAIHTDSK